MKKKLLFLTVFITLFAFCLDVNAYKCRYTSDKGEKASFTPSDAVPKITINIKNDKKNKYKSVNGKKIENWKDSSVAGGVTGFESYMASLCPEYVIFTNNKKKPKGYHIFVAREGHQNTVINSLPQVHGGWPKIYVLDAQHTPDTPEAEEEDAPTSCLDFDKNECMTNHYFACLWINRGDGKPAYCNTDNLLYVKCGSSYDIPMQAPAIISFVINLFKIATPIILIIVSVINLLKALGSSKEDEIKKAQSSFVKKLISAVLVFMVVSIVQFVIGRVADDGEDTNVSDCLSCFMNNDCEGAAYYKTDVAGEYVCHTIDGLEVDCKN